MYVQGFLYEAKEKEKKDESDDEDVSVESVTPEEAGARGSREIFELFWNGRLIPNTRVRDLSFCTAARLCEAKKRKEFPPECFYRCVARISNTRFVVTETFSTRKINKIQLKSI